MTSSASENLVSAFDNTLEDVLELLEEDSQHFIYLTGAAGTGKTTTVIGKVIYLLQNGTYQPEDILLLSFSTGTVEELQQRIARTCDNKIKVSTFHSLG